VWLALQYDVLLLLYCQETEVYFETGYQKTTVFKLENLGAGHNISGPAIVIDKNR